MFFNVNFIKHFLEESKVMKYYFPFSTGLKKSKFELFSPNLTVVAELNKLNLRSET